MDTAQKAPEDPNAFASRSWKNRRVATDCAVEDQGTFDEALSKNRGSDLTCLGMDELVYLAHESGHDLAEAAYDEIEDRCGR